MAPINRKIANQNVRLGSRRGQRRSSYDSNLPLSLILSIGALLVVIVVTGIMLMVTTWSAVTHSVSRKKNRPIPELGNTHNTVAMDIIKSLECDTWYTKKNNDIVAHDKDGGDNNNNNKTTSFLRSNRRLQTDDFNKNNAKFDDAAVKWRGGGGRDEQEQQQRQERGFMDDDYGRFNNPWWPDRWIDRQVTGRDLMCLVAGSTQFQQEFDTKNKVKLNCDAQGTRRAALLDIWSSARTQMTLDMIQKVLDLAVETPLDLVGKHLHLWIPSQEEHLKFYSEQLNKNDSSVRNLTILEGNTRGGLFVDIGSGLGLSTLAVSLLYPEATVFSIEPAMPSWLLQRISIVCNLEPDARLPHPILSGVGSKADGMLKMSWNPSASETSRAWTRDSERTKNDIFLTVRLRTLRSIMAEAAADADINLSKSKIVLNVDCEGCEYNIIPAMAEPEFNKIDVIIGTTGVHWGYIPTDKLPSSERGRRTHERLCSHYDFARQSIECCDFPNLVVKHPGNPTVSDLLGDLCLNFPAWAEEKNLYASTDDYGWTELSSMA